MVVSTADRGSIGLQRRSNVSVPTRCHDVEVQLMADKAYKLLLQLLAGSSRYELDH